MVTTGWARLRAWTNRVDVAIDKLVGILLLADVDGLTPVLVGAPHILDKAASDDYNHFRVLKTTTKYGVI